MKGISNLLRFFLGPCCMVCADYSFGLDDSSFIDEDTPKELILSPDYFKLGDLPKHGSVDEVDRGTGTVKYVPDGNFEGDDNFTWISRTSAGVENTHTYTITVEGIDDDPVITSLDGNATAAVYVSENETFVTDVNATDAEGDNGTFELNVHGGVDDNLFDLNETTGELRFKNVPDFERSEDFDRDNIYQVQVIFRQNEDNDKKDTQDISIHLEDVNDPPEVTQRSEVTVTMSEEGSPTPWVTPSLKAEDPDTDETVSLRWSIPPQAQAQNGVAQVTVVVGETPTFDYAPKTDFNGTDSFTLRVTDTSGLFAEVPVKVEVRNVNDPPVFVTSDTIQVTENLTLVLDVNASDVDTFDILTYSLAGGADQSLFDVNSSTGVLTFKSAPDFEAKGSALGDNVYQLTISVKEQNVADALPVLQILSVEVIDVNEAPVITSNEGVADAAVDAPENQVAVTTVVATDDDLDTLTYSLTGGADNAKFSIASTTGVLLFQSAPDFEANGSGAGNNTYVVEVTVTDDGAGTLTATQTITVTVTDENEAPEITSDGGGATALLNAAENQIAVTDVNASDVDTSDTLTYSLTGGADQSLFDVDSSTGALTFKTTPNFETPSSSLSSNVYVVEVTVTDDGEGTLTTTQMITVTVTDVNEAPVIDGGGATASVNAAENQVAVTTVEADDEDLSDTLTYSLTGGADQSLFDVNSSTGVLTFRSAPDFEANGSAAGNNTYIVEVNATDDGTVVLTDVQTITIEVTDLLDQPPEFVWTDANVTATFDVNVTEPNTFVIDLNATDPDSLITGYLVSGGIDQILFEINATGALAFKNAPDFEIPTSQQGGNTYYVDVNVTDGVYFATQSISVQVLDYDDEAPGFSISWGSPYEVNVVENDTLVLELNATDNNTTATAISYSIVEGSPGSPDGGFFEIDSNSSPSELKFKQAPDYENPGDSDANNTNTYFVEVNATDDTSNSSIQAINVLVQNIDEPPYFVESDFTLVEDANDTAPVLNVADPEGQPVVYNILSYPNDGNLTEEVGSLVYRPKDNFFGSDSFVVHLTDGTFDANGTASPGSLEANGTIYLHVSNVNDKPNAVDDFYSLDNKGISYELKVDDNDTYSPDQNETFLISIQSHPHSGTVFAQGDKIVYVPNSPYSLGEDTFTYEIRDRPVGDPDGLSDTAKVTINFRSNPDVPDWFHVPNFGYFYSKSGQSWLYHEGFGWIYSPSVLEDRQNVWMWHHELGWFWTGDVFPYVYLNDLSQWIYMSFPEPSQTLFYSFEGKLWLDASLLAPARLSLRLQDLSTVSEVFAVLQDFQGISDSLKNVIRAELSFSGQSAELSKLGINLNFGR